MHCRRFVDPGMSRREMLLRCSERLRRPGLSRAPARAGVRVGRRRRPGWPPDRSPQASPASRGEGPLRHLPLHGRRPVAGRYLRPQAAARPRARPADQGQDASDAVQQRRQRPAMPVEVPPVRRERHPGQRPVPARRPMRGRPGDRPLDGVELLRAHQRQLLPPHRQRPAGPARATAPGSRTDWAASARTCPASSS